MRIARKEFVYVFLWLFSFLLLSSSGMDESEAGIHFALAKQIFTHGKLDFGVNETNSGLVVSAPNGRRYVAHEVGNALFLIPTAAVSVAAEKIAAGRLNEKYLGKIESALLTIQAALYSAVTATCFFCILRTGFVQPLGRSLAANACLVLTTYFWTYSRIAFDGVLCSTLLSASLLCLLNYKNSGLTRWAFCAFVCLGLAFNTRMSMLLPIVASFVYLLSLRECHTKIQALAIAAVTLLPFVGWQCYYNSLRTGLFYMSPVQTATFKVNNGLDGNFLLGLCGLLFSPGKSILVYAPLLILSTFCFSRFFRRHRSEAIYLAVLSLLWFGLHAKMRSWFGAWGYGPRYMITILPLLILPFATSLDVVYKSLKLRIAAIAFGAAGFVLALSSIVVDFGFRLTYNEACGVNIDQLVWSRNHNQSLDILTSAFGNFSRAFTHAPIPTLSGTALPVTAWPMVAQYASGTINLWPNSMLYIGVPWYVVASLVTPLILVGVFSSVKLWELLQLNFNDTTESAQIRANVEGEPATVL